MNPSTFLTGVHTAMSWGLGVLLLCASNKPFNATVQDSAMFWTALFLFVSGFVVPILVSNPE